MIILNEEQVYRIHKLSKLKIPAFGKLVDKPTRKLGFAKGKIHLSDDWDSKETNDEIAREFGVLN